MNTLFLHGVGLTDFTVAVGLCYGYFGIIACLGFRFNFFLFTYGFGLSHGDFRLVFTLDCRSVCGGNLYTLVASRVGLTDLTVSVLFGNALLGIIDGLCGGFLTQCLNIARFVVDVGNVNVNKP